MLTVAPDHVDYPLQLNAAIYDVALKRKYSWCALYQCIDVGIGRTFRFYIFTIRNIKANAAYGFQDFGLQDIPTALGPDEDRRFPVPWLIDLDLDKIDDLLNPPITGYLDRFPVIDSVSNILREGSIIVNANSGEIHEVMEIEFNVTYNSTTYDNVVRLKSALQTPLQIFWVVPPAILVHSPPVDEFADKQPVIQVSQQVISF